MKIYRIIPLDSKGEQNGNVRYTEYNSVAAQEVLDGHAVMMADIVGWVSVDLQVKAKEPTPNWYADKGV